VKIGDLDRHNAIAINSRVSFLQALSPTRAAGNPIDWYNNKKTGDCNWAVRRFSFIFPSLRRRTSL
jgi:hypothetical protein